MQLLFSMVYYFKVTEAFVSSAGKDRRAVREPGFVR